MVHPVEHAVGIYIGLMLLACVVAIGSKLVSKLPYTIFLTLVGLGIGLFHWGPAISETGFSHELIFFVFLPPLLFQGAMHMETKPAAKAILAYIQFCGARGGGINGAGRVGGVFFWRDNSFYGGIAVWGTYIPYRSGERIGIV